MVKELRLGSIIHNFLFLFESSHSWDKKKINTQYYNEIYNQDKMQLFKINQLKLKFNFVQRITKIYYIF